MVLKSLKKRLNKSNRIKTFSILKPLLLWLFIAANISSYAQDKNNPWSIGIGANFIDVYPVGNNPNGTFGAQGELFEGFFNIKDHWNPGWPSLYISRRIFKNFSLGIQGSLNTITKAEGNTDIEYPFFSYDVFGKWHPFSAKKIGPYLYGGYGFSRVELTNATALSGDGTPTTLAGLGFKIDLGNSLGISIQSTYKAQQENTGVRFFEHQINLNYSFGGLDTDDDGILDQNDACPEVFGLKEFDGCPDTDSDGIQDKNDNCPETPGTIELQGCADQDGDGILDKDDFCPEEAGSAELNGCPDDDGDLVPNNEDECIDVAGDTENNGCPWPDSDGDGIPDKDDACPDEQGDEANGGCSAVVSELVEALNKFAVGIVFVAESDVLLGGKTMVKLSEIKTLLDTYPNGNIIIEGYASGEGSEEYNKELSMRRATAVKNYLIKIGVREDRLEVIGRGVEDPISDNSTAQGRVMNRRVQFRVKTSSPLPTIEEE